MEAKEYVLKLSLKQLALRKVAIVLWTGTDIINLIKQFRYESPLDDFQTQDWHSLVEEKVKEKTSLLGLPEAVRKELIYEIKPIGPEILKWKMHHQSFLTDVKDFLDLLSWTSVGTVDYRETARVLIKQERINIIRRYHLACVYCLDDDIPLIWENLPEDSKTGLHGAKWNLKAAQAELIVIWSRILEGDDSVPHYRTHRGYAYRTFHDYAFLRSAQTGNEAATRYFFQKLTPEVKTKTVRVATERLLARAKSKSPLSVDFPKGKFCDVLCFLLSQMDKEEQMEMIQREAFTCLKCFLNWPWQDLFMKLAGLLWAHLNKEKFFSMMTILACGGSISGCYFSELFEKLFLHAPSDFREYMMEKHWECGLWFRYLFYSNSTDSIKLVLRNVKASDREKFIFCLNGLHLCRKLIEDEKWFLLELFIAECALSEEAKAELKNILEFDSIFGEICGKERERFFHLISTANVENCSKRSLEDMQDEERDEVPNKHAKRRKLLVPFSHSRIIFKI